MNHYHELLRARAPYQRLEQAIALTRMVRQLAEADIRQRHPDAPDDEVRVRLTVGLYGRDVAAATFRKSTASGGAMADGNVPSDDVVTIARRLGKAIEEAGGAYFVGGSIAKLAPKVSRYPPPTSMSCWSWLPDRVGDLVAALGADFEVDAETLGDALQSGTTCTVFYLPTVTKIDLFAREFRWFRSYRICAPLPGAGPIDGRDAGRQESRGYGLAQAALVSPRRMRFRPPLARCRGGSPRERPGNGQSIPRELGRSARCDADARAGQDRGAGARAENDVIVAARAPFCARESSGTGSSDD